MEIMKKSKYLLGILGSPFLSIGLAMLADVIGDCLSGAKPNVILLYFNYYF